MSEIETLFQEWEATYIAAGREEDDDGAAPLIDDLHEIECRMHAVPAASLQDLALKIVAATSYGGFPVGDKLIAEAMAIGIHPVSSAARGQDFGGLTRQYSSRRSRTSSTPSLVKAKVPSSSSTP